MIHEGQAHFKPESMTERLDATVWAKMRWAGGEWAVCVIAGGEDTQVGGNCGKLWFPWKASGEARVCFGDLTGIDNVSNQWAVSKVV